MASRKKLESLNSAFGGTEAAEPQKPATDLDDPQTQADILDPNGAIVTLSKQAVRMYPFTMSMRRKAAGLVTRVLADTMGAGAHSEAETRLRLPSVIIGNDRIENEVFRLSAYAMQKPGKATDANAERIVNELQNTASPSDVVVLFSKLTELSGLQEAKKPA